MGFKHSMSGSVALWTGDPACQAGHDHIRDWLRTNVKPYPIAWVKGDRRTQGNLGETITFCVGAFTGLRNYHVFPANAFTPFSKISRNEIDLLWISFGPTAADDFAIVQEVKTTFGADLAIASSLLDDYEKSFGLDPRLTLSTHLNTVKLRLQYQLQRPDLAARINALQATSPQTAGRIHCIPTLVHDLAANDPTGKLTAIHSTLKARGWRQIYPWSVALSDLDKRFPRIVADQP